MFITNGETQMSGKVNRQATTGNDPIQAIAIGFAMVSFGEKATWDRDGKLKYRTGQRVAAEAPSWLAIIVSVRLAPGVGCAQRSA
ncbi:hypothetical protein [Mesorhizobium sp. dw_380]|uniref:hypothetical protein n=1 Tax=Mesorhizobium sp. dw_380 TaxID=2812001 RepID=UPI001BDEC636|nr:hypothetical protein [Mesorhizobium sp. dw_380]